MYIVLLLYYTETFFFFSPSTAYFFTSGDRVIGCDTVILLGYNLDTIQILVMSDMVDTFEKAMLELESVLTFDYDNIPDFLVIG